MKRDNLGQRFLIRHVESDTYLTVEAEWVPGSDDVDFESFATEEAAQECAARCTFGGQGGTFEVMDNGDG